VFTVPWHSSVLFALICSYVSHISVELLRTLKLCLCFSLLGYRDVRLSSILSAGKNVYSE